MTATTTIAKPVTLITGFLGAGKTTFLNAVIQYLMPKKLAIIENEFGEEGIDGGLIIGAENSVFELNNGCLCCSLNGDLFNLLETLWGREKEFDELVIETTGIADPASIASPFLTNMTVERYYRLKRVICLVDACHIEAELQVTEEARQQISFSDLLLITKTDLVEADYLSGLEHLLAGINPLATVLSGNKNNYPLDAIFNFERNVIAPEKERKFYLVPAPPKQLLHRHHDLVSLSFNFSECFDLSLLEHRLVVFLNFQAKDIYRVKGIIQAREHDKKIIVQSVGTDLVISAGDDWEKEEIRNSRFVFIGKNLEPAGFEKMLRQCIRPVSAI
jgi:G3E family GTPase